MKKDLLSIIENANYQRLSAQLNERSYDIAKIIKRLMNGLELDDFGGVVVKTVKTNQYTDDFLCIGESGNALDLARSGYVAGDYSCWQEAASNAERLWFLNNAEKLIKELGEYADEQSGAMEKALDETAEIK